MKRTIIAILLLMAAVGLKAQTKTDRVQSMEGTWWLGVIESNNLPYTPLNLTFSRSGDEGIEPRIYSPMQSGEPISPTTWDWNSGDTMVFQNKGMKIKLTLRYDRNAKSLAGTFKQGMLAAPITFTPTDTLLTIRRPQTPTEPYRFAEEEITVKRKDKKGNEITLAGTLTTPLPDPSEADKRYPAVVLVTGSGLQNRDEELFKHKPFLVIADYFAQRGIATLRYDDRGVGGSKGDVAGATTDDFADDAEMMFKQLLKHPKIDAKHVGIAGHSEGGTIAPMVASHNRKAAFVVMMAGGGCTGKEILLQQNEALFRARGTDDSLIAIRLACFNDIFDAALKYKEAEYDSVFKAIMERNTGGLTNKQKNEVEVSAFAAYQMAQQMKQPWMKRFIALDPRPYIAKTRCPILALNGTKDLQVLAEYNLPAIAGAAKNGQVSYHYIADCNHLFQKCEKGTMQEYGAIEETIDEGVLRMMADWIAKVTEKK